MTVLDATNLLFNFFSKNSIYSHKENFKELFTIDESDNNQLKMGIIDEALERLKKVEIVSKIEVPITKPTESKKLKIVEADTESYWVLIKPLAQWEQNVVIGADVATNIAELVNHAADVTKDEYTRCNPLAIREKDLNVLAQISKLAMQKVNS